MKNTNKQFVYTECKLRPIIKKPHILIVDDDSSTANLLKLLLNNSGFTVNGIASDGEREIDMAIKSQPDLIVMDFH